MQRAVEDAGTGMTLDSLRKLTGGDRVLVAGSAIVLLSAFLPWWDNGYGITANGFHDWGWVTIFGLLMAATLFAVRNLVPEARRPELSVNDPIAYMIFGVVEIAGAVVFWLSNNDRLVGGVKYGVFIAIVGGAVTVAGGYVKQLEAQQRGGPRQP